MHAEMFWTAPKVAEALVGAYRLMPGRPVMSTGGKFVLTDGTCDNVVEPFSWPERFVGDVQHRRILMTWARCIATGESVRDRYRDLQWKRSSAERRRLAALATIARGLNRQSGVTQA